MKIYTQRDGKSTQIANFDSVYCLQKTTNKQNNLCKLQTKMQIYAETGEKSTKFPQKNLPREGEIYANCKP